LFVCISRKPRPVVLAVVQRSTVTSCSAVRVMFSAAISSRDGGENGMKSNCAARTVVAKLL
jgi:hypothetical protein